MKNKIIAILENRAGEQLADLVKKYGGTPFSAPALAEVADVDAAQMSEMIASWQQLPPDIFIFQTGVGVKALFAALDVLGGTETFLQMLAKACVVVRGPKPTATLRARQVRIDYSAAMPFTTEEMLVELDKQPLAGKHVAVQRYGDTNVELQQALALRDAQVTEIATYRWSLPENIQPLLDLITALEGNAIDAVCFTSASQVSNFFAVAAQIGKQEALQAGLNRTVIASIGPVCSKALAQYQIHVDIEPNPPKLGPFIESINQYFSA